MRSRKLSRRMRALTAAAAVALVSGVSFGVADDGSGQKGQQGNASYTIGLFGDMPYNAQGKADYPFLLHDINEGRVAFSMFEATSRPAGIQRQLPVPRHRRRDPAAAQRGDRAQGREPALARRGLPVREADGREGRADRVAGGSELQQRAASGEPTRLRRVSRLRERAP